MSSGPASNTTSTSSSEDPEHQEAACTLAALTSRTDNDDGSGFKNSDIETKGTLEEETDGFASVEAAEQFVNVNCAKIKIDINPMMILFTMPLREGKMNTTATNDDNDHIERSTIQLYMANCNHNTPDRSKLDEITNNILGNPCGAKNAHRKNFNSDMEFVFIYADKVSLLCNEVDVATWHHS